MDDNKNNPPPPPRGNPTAKKPPNQKSPFSHHPSAPAHIYYLIGLGVIGCGGFGLLRSSNSRRCRGSGSSRWPAPTGPAARGRGGAVPEVENDEDDLEKLFPRDDVDLVYIATPPFLHHPQAMAALEAGKHVIVESAAGDDGRPGRRAGRQGPAAATGCSGRQPDATVQPAFLRGRRPA